MAPRLIVDDWIETREVIPPVGGALRYAAKPRVSIRNPDGSSRDVAFSEHLGKTSDEAFAKAQDALKAWKKQNGA